MTGGNVGGYNPRFVRTDLALCSIQFAAFLRAYQDFKGHNLCEAPRPSHAELSRRFLVKAGAPEDFHSRVGDARAAGRAVL